MSSYFVESLLAFRVTHAVGFMRVFKSLGLGVAAVIALGAFGTTRQASCGIIYSGVVNISFPDSDGVYLNVVTGQTWDDEDEAIAGGYDINPWISSSFGGTLSFFSLWAQAEFEDQHGYIRSNGQNFLVDNLDLDDVVGPADTSYGNGGAETSGGYAFQFNANNLIGFRFLNESTGMVNYGWARIAVGATFNDPSRRIVDFAYENSGGSIMVGAVPEPSSLTLLAVGSLALTVRRRK